MFNKTIADYAGLDEPWTEMADDRVSAEERLLPYYDLLIKRDWPHHDRRWHLVAQAPIAELIAWAEDIRHDEADAADDEAERPFTYSLSIPRTITAYAEQWSVVDRLAADKHRGKISPAVREIIDFYKDALGVGGSR